MAHRSDRRGATPNSVGQCKVVQAIGAPRADAHDGRGGRQELAAVDLHVEHSATNLWG
jgi:hypothetical protein